LVDDEQMRDIYARIMSTEMTGKRKCSMQTLRVLKYLDRDAALSIGRVAPYVVSGEFIPRYPGNVFHWGIDYQDIMALADAGVLDSDITLGEDINPPGVVHEWGKYRLAFAVDVRQQFSAFRLTRAGRDFFSIVEVERNEELFLRNAIFIRRLIGEPGRARATWTSDPTLPQDRWPELVYDRLAPIL
jgi:hypothetical protein